MEDGVLLREDSCRSLWFLDQMSTQYTAKWPLEVAERLVVEVEQGWAEEVVSQGGHRVVKVVLAWVWVLCRNLYTTVVFMGLCCFGLFLMILAAGYNL